MGFIWVMWALHDLHTLHAHCLSVVWANGYQNDYLCSCLRTTMLWSQHNKQKLSTDDNATFCRGCFLNFYPTYIPFHPTYQIENGINYGFGSFCFLMSGLHMFIQVDMVLKWLWAAATCRGPSNVVLYQFAVIFTHWNQAWLHVCSYCPHASVSCYIWLVIIFHWSAHIFMARLTLKCASWYADVNQRRGHIAFVIASSAKRFHQPPIPDYTLRLNLVPSCCHIPSKRWLSPHSQGGLLYHHLMAYSSVILPLW